MKLIKSALITALTIGLLIVLTYTSTELTLMPTKDSYMDVNSKFIPTISKLILTGIIFLFVVTAICIYAFTRNKISILSRSFNVLYNSIFKLAFSFL